MIGGFSLNHCAIYFSSVYEVNFEVIVQGPIINHNRLKPIVWTPLAKQINA